MSLTNVSLSLLTADADVQPRVLMSDETIEDYAEAMRAGAEFPPIVAYSDGESYWIADGFHRFYAATAAGLESLPAQVMTGDKRDAILHSVGANATHGQRRTNEDKRRAVNCLLSDAEWGGKSSPWIAERCGVSQPFVLKMRQTAAYNGYTLPSSTLGRDGKTYPSTLTPVREIRPFEPAEVRGPAPELASDEAADAYIARLHAVTDVITGALTEAFPKPDEPDVRVLIAAGVAADDGPAPEPPELVAMRRLYTDFSIKRFEATRVAELVDPSMRDFYAFTGEAFIPWLEAFATALRERGAHLRVMKGRVREAAEAGS